MKAINQHKMSVWTRSLLAVAGALLIISVFVPMWRIDLQAPQYPEGLSLLIYPDRLGGNVDIINGLNHYIGMKTLHTEDFIEFKVLPKIIWIFAALSVVVGIIGRRRLLYSLFVGFVVFGVVAMVDFYRWEYNYGHQLDPNAAIVVPGMAYQPPLIGFKQLLNFGAFSIPALGGWLFIASGVLMLASVIIEWRMSMRSAASILALSVGMSACSPAGPEPVRLNKDNCANCNMTISDARFPAEIVTPKGRVYKFDDLSCMKIFVQEKAIENATVFVADFNAPGTFLKAENAHYIQGEKVNSPMGGNVAAFAAADAARARAADLGADIIDWNTIMN